MLGNNDNIPGMPTQIKLPMGLNMIFNSLMKNLSAEMQNMNQDLAKEMNKNKNPKMKTTFWELWKPLEKWMMI